MSLALDSCVFTIDEQKLTATFELAPGEIKGIYGPSGSGKSTFFRLLAGLSDQGFESGHYVIDEKDFTDLSPVQRIASVSLMFQNPDTQFCMRTPREELLFCLENRAIPLNEMTRRIETALDFCEIRHLEDQVLTTLSGGEKQLVALACCLVLESRYLLLDEPFANLDSLTAQSLLEKLTEIQQKKKIGILLIDHQVAPVADWVQEWLLLTDAFQSVPSQLLLEQEEQLRQTMIKPSLIPIEPQPLLRFENFRLPIGRHSLLIKDEVFSTGERIGITGKSGIGKSTFFKALLQQVPYDGTIYYQEQCLTSRSRPFDRMSWVMQNPQDQFLASSVAQELANGQEREDLSEKLNQLGLWEKQEDSPFLLSQGQQRRLAVACLIDREIPILLVDEPTYGQDLRQSWQLMSLLADKAASGTLVFIISHDLRLLSDFCDRTFDFNHFVKESSNEVPKPNSQAADFIRAGFARLFSR
ncbi:ATP-binding cassette domain-containing protein [Enterococcus gallinarum]|uniref:ATP-binding cassette domain-containing protein n=2 Tax=Enterococcus TaxID=1350 RepID=A0A6I4XFL5_ENTGA|nr:ABC transporter ATP-binding protein [Enterococcus gallinarum]MXS24619.1 ATP-binding cassette domain-containing protein [Enterococcus gallinarum]